MPRFICLVEGKNLLVGLVELFDVSSISLHKKIDIGVRLVLDCYRKLIEEFNMDVGLVLNC